jgi:hypothetical protein
LSSSLSVPGSCETIRLCSLANRVWVAVSAMFSLARTSPATAARLGVAISRPSTSMAGAVLGLPRLSRLGRYWPGSSSRAPLLARLPSTVPSRSHSSRCVVPP